MSFSCQYLCTNMWDVSCARPVAASRKWFDGEYPTCCVWFSYYFMLVRYKVVAAVWCPTQTCEAGEVCSWRVLLHLPHKHAKHSSSSSSSASSCTNVCVSACSVCIWNGRSPFLGHEKPLIFQRHKDLRDEDELSAPCQHPARIHGTFSNSDTTCLCDCLLNKASIPQKSHRRPGPRFLIGAIMSQWKLKPNHKLVLSQIQLTDALPLCFFEKPLMLAGGFCTRSDGNEWYFKRFFFIRRA